MYEQAFNFKPTGPTTKPYTILKQHYFFYLFAELEQLHANFGVVSGADTDGGGQRGHPRMRGHQPGHGTQQGVQG